MSLRRIALAIGAVAATLLTGPSADAQERAETEGSADFRNPPILTDGSYADTIVTGETVWYSVIYTNNTPYRITVALADVDVETNDELTLTANFVGPTLSSLRSGTVVEGPGASYDGGVTNVWYVSVSLDTTGQLGREHELLLDLEGFSSSRLEFCEDLPDCTASADLQALQDELVRVEEQLAALGEADSSEVIEAEIDELRTRRDAAASAVQAAETEVADLEARSADAAAELQAAEAEAAEICPPGTPCDPAGESSSSTPAWAIVVGVLALLGGGALLFAGVRSRS